MFPVCLKVAFHKIFIFSVWTFQGVVMVQVCPKSDFQRGSHVSSMDFP